MVVPWCCRVRVTSCRALTLSAHTPVQAGPATYAQLHLQQGHEAFHIFFGEGNTINNYFYLANKKKVL